MVEDITIASHCPTSIPWTEISVGRHVIQYLATSALWCRALPAEHDHGDAVRVYSAWGIKDKRVIETES